MALINPSTLRRAQKISRRVVDRAVQSVVNGLVYVVDGAARPQMGNVAKELVFKRDKLEVWRVRRIEDETVELGQGEVEVEMVSRVPVPILLIPPLMVRPYVYDLRPEHSLLRTLRNAGFDVFFVDFGVPDSSDEGLRLDDYVLDFVPNSIDAVIRASGAKELTLAGYCMGGLFALLHVAAFRDARVKNLVVIGAPVNFEKLGILTVAARLGLPFVDAALAYLGNVPGSLSSIGFRVLGGTKSITKYAYLVTHLYDEEYVRGFDAIDTWLREMIPYPKEAFRQMVKDVVHGNKMLRNELTFGGRRADLRNVVCPLLAFAGTSDNIATPESTEQILDLVGSLDKVYCVVPGGHIGVIAGSSAPKSVWQPMIDWLRDRASAVSTAHSAAAS